MSISQPILALVVCLVMHVGISRNAVAQVAIRPSQLSQHSPSSQSNQSSRSAEVRYDGWSAVTPNTLTPRSQAPHSVAAEPSVRQVAYYQTQSSLSDLPVLPSGNSPTAGFDPSSLPQLPSFSDGNMNGVGAVNQNLNARGLPEPSQVLPPPIVQPPLGGDRADQFGAPSYGAQGFDGRPVSPPPQRERTLPASAAGYQQNIGPQSSTGGNAELRPKNPGQNVAGQGMGASGFGGSGAVPQVHGVPLANGLPYVTPPPRTGRYPTSPYMGPRYQLTNYQLRTVPAQTVSAQTGLSVPNAMAAAAQPPVLPQNRNVVGVYPTAYQQCAPGSAMNFPATGAVPGTSVPPTYPPNLTPGLYSPNNSGYSPLFSLGQENYNVMLGRGLVGQPTVYVPGQPFRNFFRYISP